MKIDRRSYFNEAHVVKSLLVLAKDNAGRSRIMKETGLNEASARTLLRFPEKKAMVMPSARGHKLTAAGLKKAKKYAGIVSGPSILKKSHITVSKNNVAYVVRGKGRRIKKGMEQRDNAIIMGADGLTTIIREKRFLLPGLEHWILPSYIQSFFADKCSKGDVILIGSAKSAIVAEMACLFAATKLI